MIAPSDQIGGEPLDSSNLFEVVSKDNGKTVDFRSCPAGFFQNIPWMVLKISLIHEHALNLAAWIVCIVDPGLERFHRLVKEIKK